MAITIKNISEIEKMRIACLLVAKTHELLENHIKPGITTGELDKIAYDFITAKGGIPSFKGYHGYPASICASVNEEVIHGIPGSKKLQGGDIISIDIGVIWEGYHGDAARTIPVGDVTAEDKKLIDVTRESFFEGIKYAKEGHNLHEISAAIEEYVTKFGYSVVREFVGHGIGKSLHEDPHIPHYRQKSRGPKLTKGMTLAIEPMINMGDCKVVVLNDDWTVVTADKKKSAHYENTILITDTEPEILTLLE